MNHAVTAAGKLSILFRDKWITIRHASSFSCSALLNISRFVCIFKEIVSDLYKRPMTSVMTRRPRARMGT